MQEVRFGPRLLGQTNLRRIGDGMARSDPLRPRPSTEDLLAERKVMVDDQSLHAFGVDSVVTASLAWVASPGSSRIIRVPQESNQIVVVSAGDAVQGHDDRHLDLQ